MKTRLAMTCLMAGLSLVPLMALAEDADVDRGQTGTFVKDSAITAKIKANLAAEHLASIARINVDTDANGIVWLSGTAVSQAEIDKAVMIARGTEGVVTVKNELKVNSQS